MIHDYEQRMQAYKRQRKDERLAGIITGGVVLVLIVMAIAFRLCCADLCEQRGGRVVWSTSGEVVCIEPTTITN